MNDRRDPRSEGSTRRTGSSVVARCIDLVEEPAKNRTRTRDQTTASPGTNEWQAGQSDSPMRDLVHRVARLRELRGKASTFFVS
jgi:hypothetical protein